jgi:LacI family transcriptional regulator
MAVKKSTTLKDIAKKLGATSQTVSMALNRTGRLSDETRRKVIAMAREMNYIPNAAARSLVNKKSFLFGAVMPYVSRSFFGHILAGIEEQAQLKDFSVLIGNSEGGCAVERRAIERIRMRGVDGIIALPSEDLFNYYREINESGTPVVQIMHRIPNMNELSVIVDNFQGVREAIEYWISRGHRKIGLISHGSSVETVRLRTEGFRKALADHGLEPNIHVAVPLSMEAAAIAAEELLSTNPEITALFCGSDYAAVGAVRAAEKLGRHVPDTLEVIGFDDMDFASMQCHMQISTVAQPKEEIGRLASRLLVDHLAGRKVHPAILPPRLVLRETTK